ncbi:cytochrome P450, partial [Streptomyces californicus]
RPAPTSSPTPSPPSGSPRRPTRPPSPCTTTCLGRLEAEHGLRALLTAMPGIRWADGFRPVAGGLLTRSPRTLLVRPS